MAGGWFGRSGVFRALGAWWRRWWPGVGAPGRRGERVACAYLRDHGYDILGRNVRVGKLEIDILARQRGGMLVVICEVKTSQRPAGDERPVFPEARVDARKQIHLAQAAAVLAQRYKLQGVAFRFDVVAVELLQQGKPVVRHIPGAFEGRW